jgi:DNA ligase D-like protein (predicted 3'-phosphoesterase)
MPRFVVQQHDATTLHWDFRLEIGGVYVSWAVPKGPSSDPADKRLAMRVEDHSIAWGSFEGVIGGGYGAGAVIVWDKGTYSNRTNRDGKVIPAAEGLQLGHISFELRGTKLRGAWALRRTSGAKREQWLLMKKRDEYAGIPLEPESVVSGRRIEEL